jgi:hypothetical protein
MGRSRYQESKIEEEENDGYDTRDRYDKPPVCTKMKLLVCIFLLVTLGGAAGIVYAIFGLETIKSWFGLDNASTLNTGGGGGDDNGNGGGNATAYQFMQCPVTGEGDCCNGLESNCALKVNEIMYATVHNAHSDNNTEFSNNDAPLEGALEVGYRGLMLDVCKCPNSVTQELEVIFCHGICTNSVRDPAEVFTNIDNFLTANPTEVVIINFELSVGGPIPAEIVDLMNDGMKSKTYDYVGGAWPTMKEMLDGGKQLLLFDHGGSPCVGTQCAGSINRFHDYAMETKYEFGSVDEIEDSANSCAGDRGTTGTRDFYAINNFIPGVTSLPSQSRAAIVNAKGFLISRIADCEAETSLKPNLVIVDFWQTGDLLEVTQDVNKARGG